MGIRPSVTPVIARSVRTNLPKSIAKRAGITGWRTEFAEFGCAGYLDRVQRRCAMLPFAIGRFGSISVIQDSRVSFAEQTEKLTPNSRSAYRMMAT